MRCKNKMSSEIIDVPPAAIRLRLTVDVQKG